MAVAHDNLAIELDLALIPNVGTIPPAVVLTYVGTGEHVHDLIREVAIKESEAAPAQAEAPQANTPAAAPEPTPEKAVTDAVSDAIEITHVFCGRPTGKPDAFSDRIDIVIEIAVSDYLPNNKWQRVCEVRERATDGHWYDLGHAHFQKNYCHRIAEGVARRGQARELTCFGSVGLRMASAQ